MISCVSLHQATYLSCHEPDPEHRDPRPQCPRHPGPPHPRAARGPPALLGSEADKVLHRGRPLQHRHGQSLHHGGSGAILSEVYFQRLWNLKSFPLLNFDWKSYDIDFIHRSLKSFDTYIHQIAVIGRYADGRLWILTNASLSSTLIQNFAGDRLQEALSAPECQLVWLHSNNGL